MGTSGCEKRKFKVGDKVRGITVDGENPYSITREGWVGYVTTTNSDNCGFGDDIRVDKELCEKGTYSVNSKYFELVEEVPDFFRGHHTHCDPSNHSVLGLARAAAGPGYPSMLSEIMAYTYDYDFDEDEEEIIKETKKPIMTRVSNMMKKLLDADTQTLVKAGFINGDLELTSYGRQALQELAFDDYKKRLVTLAKERIAEEKEEE